MIQMSILTLDLGKQTGWAILNDGVVHSGSESFHASRFSGGGMVFLNFRSWLNSLKEESPDVEAVYFEEVRRHIGTDASHCYGGFLAHLTAWCATPHFCITGSRNVFVNGDLSMCPFVVKEIILRKVKF